MSNFHILQSGSGMTALKRAFLLACSLAASIAANGSAHAQPGQAIPNMPAAAEEFSRSGRFDSAAAAWAEAARLYAERGDRDREADALLRLAHALRALGHQPRAVAVVEQALALLTGDSALAASGFTLSGSLFNARGLRTEAGEALERASGIARRLGRDDLLAAATQEIGNLHAALEQPVQALAAYEEAMALSQRSGQGPLAVASAINAARTALALGDVSAAISRADAARSGLRGARASHEQAFMLVSLGELYLKIQPAAKGRDALLAAAFETLREGLERAEAQQDNRTASFALGLLAQVYERESRHEEAARLTARAIFQAQQIQAPDLLYRWHWQHARYLLAQGDEEGALADYRRAAYHLQLIRSDLIAGSAASGSSFRAALAPLYFEFADLLLQRTRKLADKAQQQRLLAEARDVVEKSKSAELQDYFQDGCVAAQEARAAEVSLVGERTAVLYPIILAGRLELLLSFADGLEQITVPVKSGELIEEIRRFRATLEKRTTREFLPWGQKLYDRLIRPISEQLASRGTETIVFVPDGALRTIPLGALHDGNDFLIRRFALATTPGLKLTEPRPLPARTMNVLLNGLTLPVQGFSSLPNVDNELNAIERLFGGKQLRDREYLLKNVERELHSQPYDIVHIASHGQFQGDPKRSFLLAFDGKLTMDALERLIAPSQHGAQSIELLTLSACQTAAGDDRAALGLAGVAIKAGARSALASLWFINDQSSTVLVAEFYRNLQGQNVSKAKALQRAQLALLADGRYRHPGYWAPFLLIGNWL